MRRKKWFSTRREANAWLKKFTHETGFNTFKVFKWKHTKRSKPFFVGSHLEWLNI